MVDVFCPRNVSPVTAGSKEHQGRNDNRKSHDKNIIHPIVMEGTLAGGQLFIRFLTLDQKKKKAACLVTEKPQSRPSSRISCDRRKT